MKSFTIQIIGPIISDIRNPFFTSVVRGVEDVAYAHSYTLLLCNSDEDPTKESLYIDIMLAEKTAGVIISPVTEVDNYSGVLLQAGVPVVAMDRRMCDLDVDTVVVDNVEGACQAVSHLIEMPWALSLAPPLTAVAQPIYELGRTAADLLLRRIADPQRPIEKICLETTLVVRQSSGV